ncbi:unnamed protein product [Penicillium salamii]|uniref:NACHT domain-containing protein n=1 Tax=Penicillium salamii TaxID=1612424 RepID=A0A9W4JBN5_9EURO|nr:unnamed protein product [Penicillium salamii]CAG8198553.1 unnamed protein product [Penicillium salamii]CAG8236112.1 unnamed protein product [Penicillium salamii]CAG8383797.1 unnamed protein product [Penicillium salamii]CAG8387991.1 unnamed protein product [Penicillium salamii]
MPGDRDAVIMTRGQTPRASFSQNISGVSAASGGKVFAGYTDNNRIESDKGGLLKDSYRWVLGHDDFKESQNDTESQLLWIKGDPGKGKTMLLCGIINELTAATAEDTTTISFFFCQAALPPALITHIRKDYDKAGKQLFEGVNAWHALSGIFTSILKDPLLQRTYLIIDGLDQCAHGLPLLLDLVSEDSSANPNVKWIVSSRNWKDIKQSFDTADGKIRICLELNENSISEAVTIYIRHKVQILAKLKKFDEELILSTNGGCGKHPSQQELLEAVRCHLLSNAHGTFLWVALVCDQPKKGKARNANKLLNSFPAGLDPLCERMMGHIQDSENAEDAELCKRILAVVAIVYRPITLDELPALVEIPDPVSRRDRDLADLIADCGSFLNLHGRTVSLVHQSAKDFLLKDASNKKFSVFPQVVKAIHQKILFRSIQAIFETLRRDIYNIKHPGFPIERVRERNPDPLAIARYSCVYWVDHLKDCDSDPNIDQSLQEGGAVDVFLRQKYLHWIEALSLLRRISDGIAAIAKLGSLLQVSGQNYTDGF